MLKNQVFHEELPLAFPAIWEFIHKGNVSKENMLYFIFASSKWSILKITYHIIQGLFCSQSVLHMCMVVIPSECFVFQFLLLLQISECNRVL